MHRGNVTRFIFFLSPTRRCRLRTASILCFRSRNSLVTEKKSYLFGPVPPHKRANTKIRLVWNKCTARSTLTCDRAKTVELRRNSTGRAALAFALWERDNKGRPTPYHRGGVERSRRGRYEAPGDLRDFKWTKWTIRGLLVYIYLCFRILCFSTSPCVPISLRATVITLFLLSFCDLRERTLIHFSGYHLCTSKLIILSRKWLCAINI